jgi:excisionase family DNA binding protein
MRQKYIELLNDIDSGELINTDKVADLLGVKRITVQRLYKRGDLPGRKPLAGGWILFDREDVEKLLKRP